MVLFPGRDPEYVLRRAFRIEASGGGLAMSTALTGLRRRSSTRESLPSSQREMTALDWQVQSTMILSRTERALPRRQWLAIRAWYTIPEGSRLEAERDLAVMRLARALAAELRQREDRSGRRKRLRHVVLAWAMLGGRLPRNEAAKIAAVIGVTDRQVYRVLLARDARRDGWWRILDDWRDAGIAALEPVFYAAGWVERSAET
jgi:hypothetical protein